MATDQITQKGKIWGEGEELRLQQRAFMSWKLKWRQKLHLNSGWAPSDSFTADTDVGRNFKGIFGSQRLGTGCLWGLDCSSSSLKWRLAVKVQPRRFCACWHCVWTGQWGSQPSLWAQARPWAVTSSLSLWWFHCLNACSHILKLSFFLFSHPSCSKSLFFYITLLPMLYHKCKRKECGCFVHCCNLAC